MNLLQAQNSTGLLLFGHLFGERILIGLDFSLLLSKDATGGLNLLTLENTYYSECTIYKGKISYKYT